LFRASTGELRGIVAADWLGRFRTGAATGVAARLLARQDARVLGVLGAGGQAITQALAVITALPSIREVRVWNRTVARTATFSDRLHAVGGSAAGRVTVVPIDRPDLTVVGADLVVAITSASAPVLKGQWISDGMHVTGAGINRANAAEIDAAAVARADLVVVDHLESARREAGDLILAAEVGVFDWGNAVEVGAIAAGAHPGRSTPSQVTLFESQGIAAEDVALASLLIDRAEAAGIGQVTSLSG
jgi:ornithine cyclodeaminase/alanine dehydrogenase-like protein (mu-crystallin family)